MASYNTRSTHGKRKSENQDEIQAELSEPEPLTEPSAPLTFAQRMRLGRSAKKNRSVRGIAKVRQVGGHASNSSLETLAKVEAEPQA
jgi:hypothetical protein